MRDILEAIRKEPLLMIAVALFPLLMALIIAHLLEVPTNPIRVPPPRVAERPPPPLEPPPASWRLLSEPSDVMAVPGHPVAYWGNPKATYSRKSTVLRVKPKGIIVHYTIDLPILRLVRYQHNGDSARGGHFGYHFYVDRLGRVVQGAPLSRRTNHIRGINSRHRRPGPHAKLDSTSTIGVGMVGACIRVGRGFNIRCKGERLTPKQQAAGVALIQALIERYDLTCMGVFGHGELQTNRAPFEGITLAKFIRHQCHAKPSVLENNPVATP